MYLKLSGAILIITAAYLYGNNVSAAFRQRVRCLEELLMSLEMLQSEIGHGLTPLPEAFLNLGKRMNDPAGSLFLETAQYMKLNRGLSARECWMKALKKNFLEMEYMKKDLHLLERFGRVWGKGDKKGQLAQVALMQESLRQALAEAREEQAKNGKIWRYLGLMGGITVVIFLF